jgi:hypothetical protein
MEIDFGLEEEGKLPNTAWLLAMLSTYSPNHKYFSKDFRPVRTKAPRQLDNANGFFNNMPESLVKNAKAKRSTVCNKL